MNEENAIILQEQSDNAINSVQLLLNIINRMHTSIMKEGEDYGRIPGLPDTSKPVLFLPGMEKLLSALRLRAEYALLSSVEDFRAKLFHYRYECRLIQYETGLCVATAIGSANSEETKWKYRTASRICPKCGKETIIRGKEEYGGGWLCFAKKGGCGAKFGIEDTTITSQAEGRVQNEDIADQINTIDKIAQKRALSSAIKIVANVSHLFTVDLEDNPGRGGDIIDGEIVGDTKRENGSKLRSEGYTRDFKGFRDNQDIDAMFARFREAYEMLSDDEIIRLVELPGLDEKYDLHIWNDKFSSRRDAWLYLVKSYENTLDIHDDDDWSGLEPDSMTREND